MRNCTQPVSIFGRNVNRNQRKHKVDKKKSKKEWQDREKKIDNDIAARQKKRQENINKRIRDKQIRTLKRASKKGRLIPGF
uniref:Ribosomal RNA-processing protein 14/surfeit locus protein 6 C-terminal domain-containing protein n=1 Tax=Glossina palpalis gambiensis TaxID=67801 RepID=A0A1B0C6B0_9MUSC